ncbi:MAG: HigA family addiction module antitoxin [Spirochaetia bacterium]|nr:HigA family addiction module antitoxin [Spirochaetia bacterium]
MESKLKPFLNIGPGQIIIRNLEALGWSQQDLAEVMNMAPNIINEIIQHKRRITVDIARKLAKAFDSSPEFWLSLEMKYRLNTEIDKKEIVKLAATEVKAKIRRHMPVADMAKLGWIKKSLSAEALENMYRQFWNTNTLDFSFYEKATTGFHARKSNNDAEYTKNYSITWLQMAHKRAEDFVQKTKKFDIKYLEQLGSSIHEFTLKENGISEFIKALNDAGVQFFVLSHLQKTYLDGAAFQYKNKRFIVYTARHNRADNFWFTMAHELAHHVKHIKNNEDCFLDNLDETAENKIEKEADSLASEWLKTKQILKLAKPYENYLSEHRLNEISQKVSVETSLVLGILQYHDMVDYRKLTKYKKPVKPLIPKEYIKG